jgi:hypothetical protein
VKAGFLVLYFKIPRGGIIMTDNFCEKQGEFFEKLSISFKNHTEELQIIKTKIDDPMFPEFKRNRWASRVWIIESRVLPRIKRKMMMCTF